MLVYFFQKSLQWWCWSWQGESKSCHVHIKMDGPGQRLKKPFFYKQHTQRLSWRTAAAAPPHAVVLQRYRVLKNVVRQGKRRVENCGQILFPAAGPAHPRLCCLCCELEVEKSAVKEDFWIEGVVGGGREPFLKQIWYIFVFLSAIIQWIFERV